MRRLRKWWTYRQFKRRWIAAVKSGHGQAVWLDRIPQSEVVGYIWRNPATGQELVLCPEEVTLVYVRTDEGDL